ncbi:MAG: hypothetical protein WCV73_01270 [Patescibacteria group bacterium]|jgi:hypothetical protein
MLKKFTQSGSALLLAMLIMSSVVTASVATSRLVLNEVLQSVQLDKAVVAFYAAESGIERGLYQARKQDFDAAVFGQISSTLPNESSYQLVAKDNENVLYASLLADESYQVDLFDPGSLNGLTNSIKSLGISWEGVGSWLEIKWTPWTTSGTLDTPKSVYISQVSSPYYLQLYNSTAYLYRVRIIARNAAATNIAITAYSNVDPVANCQAPNPACQVVLPARIVLKSLGEYPVGSLSASRQAILATMPQKSPLSGLYDYVLYSEAEIKKEN